MCRIRKGLDKAFIDKQVDLLQNTLSGYAHNFSNLRNVDGLWRH